MRLPPSKRLPQALHLYRCLPFCQPSFLICFEPQKKHFLCSKPLTPLKPSQHKAYSDSWLLFCPIRLKLPFMLGQKKRPQGGRGCEGLCGERRSAIYIQLSARCVCINQRSCSACFIRVIGLMRYWNTDLLPVLISTVATIPGRMRSSLPFLSVSLLFLVSTSTR